MPTASELGEVQGLSLPPADAQEYWKTRVPMTKAEYEAAGAEAKKRAVYVGGLAKADLVREVYESMHKSMDEGTTFEAWKRDIGPRLKKAGWDGATPYRLETIYRTNVQSAYMAGRYAQMMRAVRLRPYWQYSAVADGRTRPAHLALHGKVYPADHAFWGTMYPPNGFRCRCTVKSLSERQVRARGLEVETEIPTSLDEAAHGIPGLGTVAIAPDKGFSGNVGKDWWAGLAPEASSGTVRELWQNALCRQGKGLFADDACRPSLAGLDPRHILPVGKEDILSSSLTRDEQVLAFLREFGVSHLDQNTTVTLPGGFPLVVGRGLFTDKLTGEWKASWQDKGPYMRLLARTVRNPFEAWWAPVEIGEKRRLVYSIRLLRLFADENGKGLGGFASFHLIGNQWNSATAFAPKAGRARDRILEYLESMRGGVLLYRETLK